MTTEEKQDENSLEITINNKKVPVTFGSHILLEQAKKSVACAPFEEWRAAVDQDDRFNVKEIIIQGIDFFGPRVGFLKFKAIITNEEDKCIPGVVFMRGGAVGMLVVLTCEGQEYSILTLQPRVPTGQFDFPEIPAGMLDHSGDFAGMAAKELEEECDIHISSSQLVDLTEFAFGNRFRGMYPSAGGCDEFLRLFVYQEEVTREKLDSLRGKLTGNREAGELITLKIVPLSELWHEAPDSKALSALYLYEKWKLLTNNNNVGSEKLVAVRDINTENPPNLKTTKYQSINIPDIEHYSFLISLASVLFFIILMSFIF